jgi:hypothetical protein
MIPPRSIKEPARDGQDVPGYAVYAHEMAEGLDICPEVTTNGDEDWLREMKKQVTVPSISQVTVPSISSILVFVSLLPE